MFAYEHEVRIIHSIDDDCAEPVPVDFGLPWDPEQHVESIHIHPEADQSFMDTVIGTVGSYAPSLKDKVKPSAMSEAPAF
jgi:hypothetical protein